MDRCVPVVNSFPGLSLPTQSMTNSINADPYYSLMMPTSYSLPPPPDSSAVHDMFFASIHSPESSLPGIFSPDRLPSSSSDDLGLIPVGISGSSDTGVPSPVELSSADESQSLNSSSDQGPVAFNQGVAGASSPLHPHKISLHHLASPDRDYHLMPPPSQISRPPLKRLQFAPGQVRSSSLRALLENGSSLDSSKPVRTDANDFRPSSSTDSMTASPPPPSPAVNYPNNQKPSDQLLLPTLLPNHAQQKPLIFNMDHVRYVRNVPVAQQIVTTILSCPHPQMVSITCESDCGLTRGIDLLSLAVAAQHSSGRVELVHPKVYVFDVRARTQLLNVLRPLLATPHVLKVMFDARLVLRLLRRVYDVKIFVALFDVQLAFRLLNSQLFNCPFSRQKRDHLMRVAWQCNAPSVNFHRPSSTATSIYWSSRPVTAQLLYHAAYEAFVLIPQLAVNLMAMMELALNDAGKRLFRDLSDQLISRHLVDRPFRQFKHRTQYLQELHNQVSLLTNSASVDLLGQLPSCLPICSIHSSQKNALASPVKNSEFRICGHKDGVGCDENCLPLDQFVERLQSIERNRWTFNGTSNRSKQSKSAMKSSSEWPNTSKCHCDPQFKQQMKSETKCMNLLVDQIIDLIEMKDDYLTQESSSS